MRHMAMIATIAFAVATAVGFAQNLTPACPSGIMSLNPAVILRRVGGGRVTQSVAVEYQRGQRHERRSSVQLRSVAQPSSDATVNLSSSNPALAAVPVSVSVVVPAGSTWVTFSVVTTSSSYSDHDFSPRLVDATAALHLLSGLKNKGVRGENFHHGCLR